MEEASTTNNPNAMSQGRGEIRKGTGKGGRIMGVWGEEEGGSIQLQLWVGVMAVAREVRSVPS